MTEPDNLPSLEEALEGILLVLQASGAQQAAGKILDKHPDSVMGVATGRLHKMAAADRHFAIFLRQEWSVLLPLYMRDVEEWQLEEHRKATGAAQDAFMERLLGLLAGTLYLCEECRCTTTQPFMTCDCLLKGKETRAIAVLPKPSRMEGLLWCLAKAVSGHPMEELHLVCRKCIDAKSLLKYARIVDPS